MTDVADRHWGTSLVRAPTAKDAAQPDGNAGGGASDSQPRLSRRGGALFRLARDGSSPHPDPPPPPPEWEAIVTGIPAPAPPVTVTPPPAPPVVAAPRTPVPDPADADAPADNALAKLARGVQDCARALASLADRLDALERRLDASGPAGPIPRDLMPRAAESLGSRIGALEGVSADRYQLLEQRLRRLEALPDAVVRLQRDSAHLADAVRSRGSTTPGGPVDLDPVYLKLGSVVEMVSAHHTTASQSLDRVRALERAVLEMRRQLERNLSEQNRATLSEQAATRARMDSIEARIRTVT
ncbi:MAG TPA: hypothetical protein VF244_05570 [Acidimicrobiales bacterium]